MSASATFFRSESTSAAVMTALTATLEGGDVGDEVLSNVDGGGTAGTPPLELRNGSHHRAGHYLEGGSHKQGDDKLVSHLDAVVALTIPDGWVADDAAGENYNGKGGRGDDVRCRMTTAGAGPQHRRSDDGSKGVTHVRRGVANDTVRRDGNGEMGGGDDGRCRMTTAGEGPQH